MKFKVICPRSREINKTKEPQCSCMQAPKDFSSTLLRYSLYVIKWTNFKFFFKKDFISFFLEEGEEREKNRERDINVWLPLTCP